MEYSILKARKGQVAIEFMLLIVVMLLFVQAVIIPSVELSTSAVEDTTRLGQARFAAERIANAIDYLAASPGDGKQTLHVFVPESATISCATNAVQFSIDRSDEDSLPAGSVCMPTEEPNPCVGEIETTAEFNCAQPLQEMALYTVTINKASGVISVSAS